jgi:hypothetical protein
MDLESTLTAHPVAMETVWTRFNSVVISLYNSIHVDELSIGNSISCSVNEFMDEELYNTFTSKMLTINPSHRCLCLA